MTYSNQQIRAAILVAADHIDSNPEAFEFSRIGIPRDHGPGDTACALGWIGHFLGMWEPRNEVACAPHSTCFWFSGMRIGDSCKTINQVLTAIGLTSIQGPFYDRLDALLSEKASLFDRLFTSDGYRSWLHDGKKCAKALRLYADRYHPAPAVPDWTALAYAPQDNHVPHPVLA
jgi:hypothetical protein